VLEMTPPAPTVSTLDMPVTMIVNEHGVFGLDPECRWAESSLNNMPERMADYVRDESLTFEQFKHDPSINVSVGGYEFTEGELASFWRGIVEDNRVRRSRWIKWVTERNS
jgi:hypothetical protein